MQKAGKGNNSDEALTRAAQNKMKLSQSRADDDEEEGEDYVDGEEVSNADGKVDLERAGIEPKHIPVLRVPEAWHDDILSYHHNEKGLLDPYGPEEVRDSPPEYVAVIKITNPVARDWVTRQAERCLYMYITEANSNGGSFTSTDVALCRLLGTEGNARVCAEIRARMTELLAVGLLIRDQAESESAAAAGLPTAVREFMERSAPMTVARACFYGSDEVRLNCMKGVKVPSPEELVAEYLKNHDGHGGAVAIPLSFLNRFIRTMKRGK